MECLEQLPMRVPIKLRSAVSTKFSSNLYKIKVKGDKIYQYTFQIFPNIQNDSTELTYQIINSAQQSLGKSIGKISIRGSQIYGKVDMPIPKTFKSSIMMVNEKAKNYEILVKKVKSHSLSQIFASGNILDIKLAQRIINIDFKQALKGLNMKKGSRGDYLDNKTLNVNKQFNIIQGYDFSFQKLSFDYFSRVELVSKVIRRRNLHEEISQIGSKDQILQTFLGSIVVTNYGNRRTYKIIDIDFKLTPLSVFEMNGQSVSYIQYYYEQYNVKIQIKNQPLIKAVQRVEKCLIGGKFQRVFHYIYLIPELVSSTNFSEANKKDNFLMKQISKLTCFDAQKRIQMSNSKLCQIKKQLILCDIMEAHQLQGYQLSQPQIQMKRKFKVKNGTFNLKKQKLENPRNISNWSIYFLKSYKDEAQYLEQVIISAGKEFDIKVEYSRFCEMTTKNHQEWRLRMKQDLQEIERQKQPKPQIFVIVIGGIFDENFYHKLKNMCTTEFKICSQMVKLEKIKRMEKQKSMMSFASNIFLQIICKANLQLWAVCIGNEAFKNKNIAIGAFSFSKIKNLYNFGFYGTTNKKLNTVFSRCFVKRKNITDFNVALYERLFTQWLKAIYLKNNRNLLPDILILYKEGNENQQQSESSNEVVGLKLAISNSQKMTKFKNFNPQIICMLVNKGCKTRIYKEEGKSSFRNPPSGSVVLNVSPNDKNFSFILNSCSNEVGIPQSNPCQFTVYHHSPARTPVSAFVDISYEQCFNYYNFKGAVKIPAQLQYANKLAKLAGQNFESDFDGDHQISRIHYFL